MSLVEEKVKKVIKELKPEIQAHGGDLELVSVKKGQVVIEISGACLGCPMAGATFGVGMEEMIKKAAPEVKGVKFVT